MIELDNVELEEPDPGVVSVGDSRSDTRDSTLEPWDVLELSNEELTDEAEGVRSESVDETVGTPCIDRGLRRTGVGLGWGWR